MWTKKTVFTCYWKNEMRDDEIFLLVVEGSFIISPNERALVMVYVVE
jgi:hypothetical protein